MKQAEDNNNDNKCLLTKNRHGFYSIHYFINKYTLRDREGFFPNLNSKMTLSKYCFMNTNSIKKNLSKNLLPLLRSKCHLIQVLMVNTVVLQNVVLCSS